MCTRGGNYIDHLLVGCVYGHETWFWIPRYIDLQKLTPRDEMSFFDWWLKARKQVSKIRHKGFDSLAPLVAWLLWNERNRRVHDRVALPPVALALLILEETQ
jgi:hypothetical protein